ncbi:helix-turn-helix domain-containing protein [Paenibacillus sp. GCM10012303]|jgi:AraC-like DNA-binding protein|uniref:AraC family transcriptional regulator n=1 Tax=Paenibacillus sp. GCM10012303 TaxID=3317340 RepID=UPI00361BD47E
MDIEVIFPNMTSTLQIKGCGFFVKPPGWSYPLHHHHLFEILYCFSGEVVQFVGVGERKMRAGDWMLLKAGVRHRLENLADEPYSFLNIHFDVDDPDLRRQLNAADCFLLGGADAVAGGLAEIVTRVERLMALSLTDGPSSDPSDKLVALDIAPLRKLELQAAILLIVTSLTAQCAATQAPGGKARPSVASFMEIETAHAIEERLRRMVTADSDESVARIARDLHLSRSRCSKLFTKVYGVSPRRYVSELILNRAKRLLVTTNLPIEGIALELGFHSLSHFSCQFRRWTGVSPMQYRPKYE